MQLLVYILVYPILWIISILPMRILYVTSDVVYVIIYHLIGYRKKTVRENLNLVFPEKSDSEKKDIEKKFYHHFCDIMLEAIKSLTISEAEIKKRMVPNNVEMMRKLESKGKSVVLMLPHYANWEWAVVLETYVSTYKTYAIYKRLKNKYFDAMIKRMRAKYKSNLITTKEAIITIKNAEKKGEITLSGFISDQTPKTFTALHWCDFMNIKVPVYTGAEMISKKLDLGVIYLKINKVKRGYYKADFEIITLNPKEYEDYEITEMFLKLVEKQIRETPEYYLWTHKRWKHRNSVPEKFK